ncbi:MAG: PDDEXK nuclease domain-containing protein [Lachnospiraceae bacterium]|nr:PDDEXK nuclease domain-containing protein [Lachnospiraceae bacterium]
MNNDDYFGILDEIKKQIRKAQYQAVISANYEMIMLYWNIGNHINKHKSWGSKFIENLARDIKLAFPDITGFSIRNMKYMAKFSSTYPEAEFVQRALHKLPWRHNIVIMEKVKDSTERKWYITGTIENGWTRDTLVHQIESNLYMRQIAAKKTTNYTKLLPEPHGELARQTIKDPYIFDFITVKGKVIEREVESELVRNISKLLLELGKGFAFVGNQYHLEIEGEDFYIDLLFYHLELRCYVVIELKTGNFLPEYAGKLNFYLSAVDDIIKKDCDNPSIGILLCKNKRGMIAEYALKDVTKPIGVTEYKLLGTLPQEYEKSLPSIEDIRSRIAIEMDTTVEEGNAECDM